MKMFDTRGKILKEVKRLFKEGKLEGDFLQYGIPQDILIKKIAKTSYTELKLEDFNKEYPNYGIHIDELIEQKDLWRTGINRVMVPQKGEHPPMGVKLPQKNALESAPKPVGQASVPPIKKEEKIQHDVLDMQQDSADKKGQVPPPQKKVSKKTPRVIGVPTIVVILLITFSIGSVAGVLLRQMGF